MSKFIELEVRYYHNPNEKPHKRIIPIHEITNIHFIPDPDTQIIISCGNEQFFVLDNVDSTYEKIKQGLLISVAIEVMQ